jgi:hypothetical protein
MKLKIQFIEEIRFIVPNRKALPTRMVKPLGHRLLLRSLAMAERPNPWKRYVD